MCDRWFKPLLINLLLQVSAWIHLSLYQSLALAISSWRTSIYRHVEFHEERRQWCVCPSHLNQKTSDYLQHLMIYLFQSQHQFVQYCQEPFCLGPPLSGHQNPHTGRCIIHVNHRALLTPLASSSSRPECATSCKRWRHSKRPSNIPLRPTLSDEGHPCI
jgi:hypothetical protein